VFFFTGSGKYTYSQYSIFEISASAEVGHNNRKIINTTLAHWDALVKPQCTDGQPTTSSHER
jgi:hypothetical protein